MRFEKEGLFSFYNMYFKYLYWTNKKKLINHK